MRESVNNLRFFIYLHFQQNLINKEMSLKENYGSERVSVERVTPLFGLCFAFSTIPKSQKLSKLAAVAKHPSLLFKLTHNTPIFLLPLHCSLSLQLLTSHWLFHHPPGIGKPHLPLLVFLSSSCSITVLLCQNVYGVLVTNVALFSMLKNVAGSVEYELKFCFFNGFEVHFAASCAGPSSILVVVQLPFSENC